MPWKYLASTNNKYTGVFFGLLLCFLLHLYWRDAPCDMHPHCLLCTWEHCAYITLHTRLQTNYLLHNKMLTYFILEVTLLKTRQNFHSTPEFVSELLRSNIPRVMSSSAVSPPSGHYICRSFQCCLPSPPHTHTKSLRLSLTHAVHVHAHRVVSCSAISWAAWKRHSLRRGRVSVAFSWFSGLFFTLARFLPFFYSSSCLLICYVLFLLMIVDGVVNAWPGVAWCSTTLQSVPTNHCVLRPSLWTLSLRSCLVSICPCSTMLCFIKVSFSLCLPCRWLRRLSWTVTVSLSRNLTCTDAVRCVL